MRNYPLILIIGFVLFASQVFAAPTMAGDIKIDGSSTVYPITEAVAEEFGIKNKGARVTVGVSGTGGGFKKFCKGETQISNASRHIKDSEKELCAKEGINFIELPVAYDALSVVVNKKNTWLHTITIAELKKLWEPEAQKKITHWNQIRADWPNKPIALFGPGVDSGTFDYFTEVVVGKAQASRGDFTSSEDDNVLVQGVANNINALGFFGMAYYQENKDKLTAVKIENGKGGVLPTIDNVVSGKYEPLSRPLFIYVNKNALATPTIKEFVAFYLDSAPELANEVGYVQLPSDVAKTARATFDGATASLLGKTTKAAG